MINQLINLKNQIKKELNKLNKDQIKKLYQKFIKNINVQIKFLKNRKIIIINISKL